MSFAFDPAEHPHRRRNPLTGEWILVSPHRTKRPWQGQVESPPVEVRAPHDLGCYLCPGNERAGGLVNPHYSSTFVFKNDFAALLEDGPREPVQQGELFLAEPETGLCRVVCFSPRHDVTLPEMTESQIGAVINVWAEQWNELAQLPDISYVQIFENKGAMMGCSNPHPHGQIWANHRVPYLPMREDQQQREYFERIGRPLLLNYVVAELKQDLRIVVTNPFWVALVPYWATWPFEIMLLPLRHVTTLSDLTGEERNALAAILKQLLTRYDNLFETSFPYSMGWHARPCDDAAYDHWQLHAHFYPPLLRSATVRKFMVGYELLAMPQRDITAEQAAARLREGSDDHFRLRSGAG